MGERKHMDLTEWREMGGLQEVNRLFFHPCGLALEMTLVDEGGWSEDSPSAQALAAKLKANGVMIKDTSEDEDWDESDYIYLAREMLTAQHPPGSVFLSGIWDAREDPEGIVFGTDPDDKREKAIAVHEERQKRFEARRRLFDNPRHSLLADVEPLDWVSE